MERTLLSIWLVLTLNFDDWLFVSHWQGGGWMLLISSIWLMLALNLVGLSLLGGRGSVCFLLNGGYGVIVLPDAAPSELHPTAATPRWRWKRSHVYYHWPFRVWWRQWRRQRHSLSWWGWRDSHSGAKIFVNLTAWFANANWWIFQVEFLWLWRGQSWLTFEPKTRVFTSKSDSSAALFTLGFWADSLTTLLDKISSVNARPW